MSIYSDWDVVYAQTYEALNRKLSRMFFQQRDERHALKQVVALAIDQTNVGLTGGFDWLIVLPGKYKKLPSVEVSYFDDTLQKQGAPQPVAILNASGEVSGFQSLPAPQPLLFVPPGIQVRPNPLDSDAAPALVLTSLQVGRQRPTATGSLRDVLRDWLKGSRDKKAGIIQSLNAQLAPAHAADWSWQRYSDLVDTILPIAQSHAPADTLAGWLGGLMKALLAGHWREQSFWQSSYLQTLATYKTLTDITALQRLYAYAVRLGDQKPDVQVSKSTDIDRLRSEIDHFYKLYFDKEVEVLTEEVVFRARVALVGRDFQFATETVAETTLATPINGEVPAPIVAAILEAFACLAPTRIPDLLAGVFNKNSLTDPYSVNYLLTAFELRLGAWRLIPNIAPTTGIATFTLAVTITGGFVYQAKRIATEPIKRSMLVLNDANTRSFQLSCSVKYLELTHKNPTYNLDPNDLSLNDYVKLLVWDEERNDAAISGFAMNELKSTITDFTSIWTALDPITPVKQSTALLNGKFFYGYTRLFSHFNLLDDLATLRKLGQTSMDWARVTEYRFQFLELRNATGEIDGKLYITGSVNPRGASTELGPQTGGDLNQLDDDDPELHSDALLYVARPLLMRQIFLPVIARLFRAGPAAELATSSHFIVTNRGDITNVADIALRYGDIKYTLLPDHRVTLEKLQLTDESLFAIPAGKFVFGAENSQLLVEFRELIYSNLLQINKLKIRLDYAFERRNGVDRYVLQDSLDTVPELTLNYGDSPEGREKDWAYGGLISNSFLTGFLTIATITRLYKFFRRPAPPVDLLQLGADDNLVGPLLDIIPIVPPPVVPLQASGSSIEDNLSPAHSQPNSLLQPTNIKTFSKRKHGEFHNLFIRTQNEIEKIKQIRFEIERSRRISKIKHPTRKESEFKDDSRHDLIQNDVEENQIQKAAKELSRDEISAINTYTNLIYLYLKKRGENPMPPIISNENLATSYNLPHRHNFSLDLHQVLFDEKGKKNKVHITLTDIRILLNSDGLENSNLGQEIRQVTLVYEYPESRIDLLDFVDFEKALDNSQNDAFFQELRKKDDPYGSIMRSRINNDFNRIIRRSLVEEATKRHNAAEQKRYIDEIEMRDKVFTWIEDPLGVLLNIASLTSAIIFFLSSQWKNGYENAQSDLRELFLNSFANSIVRNKLNLIKFPYEEHFDINKLTIDQDGLKIGMKKLNNRTLTFGRHQSLKQSVCTYINTYDLESIRFIVAGLESNNRVPQNVNSVEFTIGFAHPTWPSSEPVPTSTTYVAVGAQIPIKLTRTGEQSWQLVPDIIRLADFKNIGSADTLLVTRTDARDFALGELNMFNIAF